MLATDTLIEEDLEVLLSESIANPCDCDHEQCSVNCMGHHLDLPAVDTLRGIAHPAGKGYSANPCPSSASWVVSLSAELEGGFIPPSPRYLCDPCKEFWSRNEVLTIRAERL